MTGAAEGWRAGDLAVCVTPTSWWKEADGSPARGPVGEQVVRVLHVYAGIPFKEGTGIGLEVAEFPDEIYPAVYFRKVKPDHSPADDAAFLALIKRVRTEARA